MSDAADRAALDVFTLALRVALHAYEIDAPATEYEKPWRLLRQIADGELTLMSPAELAARYPNLKDFLYDQANDLVQHDRAVALSVLRGLGSLGQEPDAPPS
jgi:hypothetical protein